MALLLKVCCEALPLVEFQLVAIFANVCVVRWSLPLQLLARVSINSSTGQPIGYSHPLCSDAEKWRFGDWVNWANVTRSQPDTSSSSSEHGGADNPE